MYFTKKFFYFVIRNGMPWEIGIMFFFLKTGHRPTKCSKISFAFKLQSLQSVSIEPR